METIIIFLRAVTAFDIFGTNNAGELVTCGFQYPFPSISILHFEEKNGIFVELSQPQNGATFPSPSQFSQSPATRWLIVHGGRDDSILSAKLIIIAPEISSF